MCRVISPLQWEGGGAGEGAAICGWPPVTLPQPTGLTLTPSHSPVEPARPKCGAKKHPAALQHPRPGLPALGLRLGKSLQPAAVCALVSPQGLLVHTAQMVDVQTHQLELLTPSPLESSAAAPQATGVWQASPAGSLGR